MISNRGKLYRHRMIMLVFLLIPLVGCVRTFDFTTLMDGTSGQPLTIHPPVGDLYVDEEYVFEATGGSPPYSFAIADGDGSIDEETGTFIAPSLPGFVTVRVTDIYGFTSEATVEVLGYDELLISPSAISVTVGKSVQFSGFGGKTPYTYSLAASGSGSPSVDPSTGLYTAGQVAGTDEVMIQDSTSIPNTATATVTVAPLSDVDYTVGSVVSTGGTTGGGSLSGEFAITNIGDTDGSQPVSWWAYVSTDEVLSGGDQQVDSGTLSQLVAGDTSVATPFTGTWPLYDGDYYLIVSIGSGDDENIANNTGASGVISVTGTPPPDVDYVVTAVSNTNTPATAGDPIAETFDLENSGSDNGGSTVYWTAYVSTDTALDGADIIADTGNTSALNAAGSNAGIVIAGAWPDSANTYYLIVSVSAEDDGTPANNYTASTSFTIDPPDINYTITGTDLSTPPVTAYTDDPITESFSFANTGSDNGERTVYWTAYASTDGVLNGTGDILIGSGTGTALNAASTSGTISFSGFWPSTGGTYWLIVQVEADDDTDITDNWAATASSTDVSVYIPQVDYQIDDDVNNDISALPATAYMGEALSESFTFRNTGTDNGSKTVYWTAYASLDGVLDGSGETVVDSGSTGALNSGGISSAVAINGTWPAVGGTYSLIVKVESDDDTDTTNNTAVSTDVTDVSGYPDVDYSVSSVVNTGGTTAGGALSGEFEFVNEGTSGGSQTVYWEVYVSTDQVYGGDILVESGNTTPLAAGATSLGIPFSGTWPSADNTYYLIVRLDATDDGNSTNNTGASAAVTVTGGTTSDVNYVVDSVSNNTPSAKVGDAISEQFDLRNAGTVAGSQDVQWTAYASTNTELDAGDSIVDSGTVAGGLAAGASVLGITIGGNWPYTAGTYRLIVSVFAGDETVTTDNTGVSSSFTLEPLNIDYEVVTITATNTPAGVSSDISETFTIRNNGTDDGVADVYWFVYSSTDQMLDASDSREASGVLGPLTAGATSSSIAINGVWPSTPDIYYLIVELSASDDVTSINNRKASDAFTINQPDTIDYVITDITSTYQTVTTGSTVSEKFSVQNIGDTAGAEVNWYAYVSADATLDGMDTPISSGATAALAGGATQSNITIGGTWPSAGSWYLIVELEATDDVTTNNVDYAGPFTVYDPPDYEVDPDTVALPAMTEWALVGDQLSVLADSVPHEFTIHEIAGGNGNQVINWSVYASTDTLFDAGDTLIDSGSISPLSASGTSGLITFDGLAPSVSGHYFLLIRVQSGDDKDVTNDVYVSAKALPVMDHRGFTETTNVETDTDKVPSINQAEDFAIWLDQTETADTAYINGLIDTGTLTDLFKITTGSAVTQLDITLTWSTGGDDLNMSLLSAAGGVLASSADVAADSEPAIPPWTVTGLLSDTVYYVEVQACGNGAYEGYELTIIGGP